MVCIYMLILFALQLPHIHWFIHRRRCQPCKVGTPRHLAKQSLGIEPATCWLPDNLSYFLSGSSWTIRGAILMDWKWKLWKSISPDPLNLLWWNFVHVSAGRSWDYFIVLHHMKSVCIRLGPHKLLAGWICINRLYCRTVVPWTLIICTNWKE